MSKKRCKITKYDETIKEPPYLTVYVDATTVEEPDFVDQGGVEFHLRLRSACHSLGHEMKFYTLSNDNLFDYELVIK